MLFSLIIASVLAIGAVASPIEKRLIVTEVATQVQTITVYVTAVPATEPVSPPATPTEAPVVPEPTPPQIPADRPAATNKDANRPAPTQKRPDPAPSAEAPSPAPEAPSSTQVADDSHPTGNIQATLHTGPGYEAAMLYHHNVARANHGAKPLIWDSDCEAGARRTADMCIFKHPDFLSEIKQGQNLFATSGDVYNATAGITESWYKGELDAFLPYLGSANIPSEVFHHVGHLTQMLWKGTTKVGCVTVDCGGNMKLGDGTTTDMNKFTVCNYAGPGNWAGKYAENLQGPGQTANLGNWAD